MGDMGDAEEDVHFHLKLSAVSQNASWAIAHELGHNIQWLTGFEHSEYEETTNNFWSLYCYEKVSLLFKISRDTPHFLITIFLIIPIVYNYSKQLFLGMHTLNIQINNNFKLSLSLSKPDVMSSLKDLTWRSDISPHPASTHIIGFSLKIIDCGIAYAYLILLLK